MFQPLNFAEKTFLLIVAFGAVVLLVAMVTPLL